MTTTFERLAHALRALEAELPEMLQLLPDESDFWTTFATHVEYILNGLGSEHGDFVRSRVSRMLGAAGLIGPGSTGESMITGWTHRLGHGAGFRADAFLPRQRYRTIG